jgi:hypothetical protein
MQPESHALVLRRALERIEARHLAGRLGALLEGNDDEDKYTWPLLGWRTPAFGLTHTFRPGRSRGELLFPSAKTRCVTLFGRAREGRASDPDRAAHWLGRAAHLLTDSAVPARTRGVWHYLGDPLESWIEQHLDEVRGLPDAEIPVERTPGELIERLAARSCVYPADTTKSVPGLVRHAFGLRVRVTEPEAAGQARALVPEAIAHVAALLLGFEALGV